MFPSAAKTNELDVLWRHTESRCQFLTGLPSRVFAADCANISFGQFGLVVSRSSWPPSLLGCVSVIVSNGAEKQVVWADTPPVVAFVENAQSARDATICHDPRKSVGGVVPVDGGKVAIPAPRGSGPLPTLARLVNLGPEIVRRVHRSLASALSGACFSQPVKTRGKVERLPTLNAHKIGLLFRHLTSFRKHPLV